MDAGTKKAAYSFCSEQTQQKKERIVAQLNALRESLLTETKSSAGDKHETGRAMMQLEREKLGRQLMAVEKEQQTLANILVDKLHTRAALGSLVLTDRSVFFMAISAGEMKHRAGSIFCISLQSPIGRALLGKAPGDTITFNGTQITIKALL